MRREIKFRVWSEKYKEMRHWGFIEGGMFTGIPTGAGLTLEDCAKSMQFTGLKDKNGTPIYEGDIVMLSNKFTYTVSFEDGKFVCYHAAQTNSMRGLKWGDLHRALDPDFSDYDFRVIGNIYETPELL